MNKHVLFIHGAGRGAYDEDGLLVASLQTLSALPMTYAIPECRTRTTQSMRPGKLESYRR
jgi:hypothetical protein